MVEALSKRQQGWHHDPFELLGIHPGRPGYVVRAFMPSAESVELEGMGPMSRREGSDTFEITISKAQKENLPQHYRLSWIEKEILNVLPKTCIASKMGVSTDYANDTTVYLGCRKDGIMKTHNAVENWLLELNAEQLADGAITSIAL